MAQMVPAGSLEELKHVTEMIPGWMHWKNETFSEKGFPALGPLDQRNESFSPPEAGNPFFGGPKLDHF